jgi:hypothetical protein
MLISSLAGYTIQFPLHLTTPVGALAFFQAQDSINSGNSKTLLAFVIIAALALAVQAIVVLAVGLAMLKARTELLSHVSELKGKAIPLIEKSHALVIDLTPQIKEITAKVNTITGHVETISGIVETKATEIAPTVTAANETVLAANETVRDANLKTRAQISRVNGMVSSALDATVRLGVAIEQGIAKPGREVAGVIAGLKAGLDTLLSGAKAFGSGGPVGQRPKPPVRPGAMPTYRAGKSDL